MHRYIHIYIYTYIHIYMIGRVAGWQSTRRGACSSSTPGLPPYHTAGDEWTFRPKLSENRLWDIREYSPVFLRMTCRRIS